MSAGCAGAHDGFEKPLLHAFRGGGLHAGSLDTIRYRVPTTLRIALLAGLLALLSNLAVIGFIYSRTHDEALAQMRQQVVEQDKVLMDVYRSGGRAALRAAIADAASSGDPEAVVAILMYEATRSSVIWQDFRVRGR